MSELPVSWEADYFDGHSAERRTAIVEPRSQGLVVQTDAGERVWAWIDVRLTMGRRPGDPIRLELGSPPSPILILRSPAFFDAVSRVAPFQAYARGLRQKARGSLRNVSAGIGAAALLLWFGYSFVLPAVSRWLAFRVPPTWERELGDAAISSLAIEERRCRDPEAVAALRALANQLVLPEERGRYELDVTIVRYKLVNAVALPGGRILVFSGLLEKMGTPEQVAGVLAHELEHVYLRHGTQAVMRQLSLYLMLSATLGDVSGISASALDAAKNLAVLNYTRTHERDADAGGMKRLQALHLPTKGMLEAFEILGKEEPEPVRRGSDLLTALSSHPPTAERLRTLRWMTEAAPAPTASLGDAATFRKQISGCL
jgi:predicted Zn-dependent protease